MAPKKRKLENLLINSFFTIAVIVSSFIPFIIITAIYHRTQNPILGLIALTEGLITLYLVTPIIHAVIEKIQQLLRLIATKFH